MKTFLLFLLSLTTLNTYSQTKDDFKMCNDSSYFEVGAYFYEGGEKAIHEFLKTKINPNDLPNQNGYISIAFFINCDGKKSAFTTMGVDKHYKEFVFNDLIIKNLIESTKLLTDWKPFIYNDKNYDAKITITYKIKNGNIEFVM